MTSRSDKQTGGPAFPTGTAFQGMTLRDYFAAKAMQGLIASHNMPASFDMRPVALKAYIMADAMLKARDGKADKPEDPCPGCRPGVVCRTPSCGRLKARDGTQ